MTRLCKHCGGDVEVRNPTGFCDHLRWPENLTDKAKLANGLPVSSERLMDAATEDRINKLECAAWAAWMELNAIRARDGVPWTHQGWKSDVSEEYFSQVVDALADVLGEAAKPWPQNRWLEQDGSLPWVKP